MKKNKVTCDASTYCSRCALPKGRENNDKTKQNKSILTVVLIHKQARERGLIIKKIARVKKKIRICIVQ